MNNRQIVALVIGVVAALAAMLTVSPRPVPGPLVSGPRVLGIRTAVSYQRMSLTAPAIFLGVGALTAWAVYALRSRGLA